MSTDFRALFDEHADELSFGDGTERVTTFEAFEAAVSAALARWGRPAAPPAPEVGEVEGRWSEGVCGDGAAILFDGVMIPIEEVVQALNRAPADRLALALCHDRWPSLNCQQPCRYCRVNSAAVVRELAKQAGSAKPWHVDQLSAIAAELEGSND